MGTPEAPVRAAAAPTKPSGIHRALEGLARDHGDRTALCTPEASATYAELYRACQRWQRALASCAGRRVGVVSALTPAWPAVLAALDALGARAFLLSPLLTPDQVEALAARLRLDDVLDAGGALRERSREPPGATPAGGAEVTILTSGTTGEPKAVGHTWQSLMRPARIAPHLTGSRWLLTYPPHLYAGLQVLMQCWLNGGCVITPGPGDGPEETCRRMLSERAEYVSATPSFWRRLLLFGARETLRSVPLKQLTLGGEASPEDLLAQLRELFPVARIVHIYATSELGRCFSVTDGRAGFPAAYLATPPEEGVQLKVEAGELFVRSGNAMKGYDPVLGLASPGAWLATGDLVELRDDRVLFRGRRTDLINAGGNKVHPSEVEAVLRGVAGVGDVRVYPVPSSLVGELVGAEVVLAAGHEEASVRAAIAARAAEALRTYQRPRIVRFVPRIELLEAGKLQRRRERG